jgi:acyl dehydratase
VAVNTDYIGRTYPASAPYEVSRVKIAEFADAIGDGNPLYRDRAAAQAAGYPDVINYAMVVHGEQSFTYSRPLRAGDVVTAQSTISNIRAVGSLTMVTTETRIQTLDGEHVCTGHGTLVERGTE